MNTYQPVILIAYPDFRWSSFQYCGLTVYTDGLEHTARSFGASLPLVQCTLSGKQSNLLFCLITKGHISKAVSMGHLCRQKPCH